MGSGKPLDGLWKWVNLSLASYWNEINNLQDTNLVCGFAHDSIHIIHVPFLTQHPSSASTSIWGPFLMPGPTLIQVVHVWCGNHDGILGHLYFDLYHMLWCCLSHHLHISIVVYGHFRDSYHITIKKVSSATCILIPTSNWMEDESARRKSSNLGRNVAGIRCTLTGENMHIDIMKGDKS